MTILLIILGIAIVIAAIIVIYVTKVENDSKIKWEEHKWQTEADKKYIEDTEKKFEDLEILFEDIWDEVKK